MKKFFFLMTLLLTISAVKAQNIQLHYDFGRGLYNKDLSSRPLLTSTVEMFKPDKWGSTFFFIDMDYTSKGIASAYWEISREFTLFKSPFSFHVEYNGGLSNHFSYNNAYLTGATYSWNKKDYTAGITLSAMYKYIQKSQNPNSFQLTGTWYFHFGRNGLCTFSGFADFWREKDAYSNPYGEYIFLSEPQFWLNLNRLKGVDKAFKLSVGSELELSNNFAARKGFYAIPTLAVKWSFD